MANLIVLACVLLTAQSVFAQSVELNSTLTSLELRNTSIALDSNGTTVNKKFKRGPVDDTTVFECQQESDRCETYNKCCTQRCEKTGYPYKSMDCTIHTEFVIVGEFCECDYGNFDDKYGDGIFMIISLFILGLVAVVGLIHGAVRFLRR